MQTFLVALALTTTNAFVPVRREHRAARQLGPTPPGQTWYQFNNIPYACCGVPNLTLRGYARGLGSRDPVADCRSNTRAHCRTSPRSAWSRRSSSTSSSRTRRPSAPCSSPCCRPSTRCFPDLAQLFHWPKTEFVSPLDWPTDGIFYDFPSKDGCYHAVSEGDGSGCACVTRDTPEEPQFTKLWSWGKRGSGGSSLSDGRPKTEYYEPWASAFNFAFFQRAQFKPFSRSSFEMAVLPIESGLDAGKADSELRDVVENAIDKAGIQLAPTSPGLPFFTGEK